MPTPGLGRAMIRDKTSRGKTLKLNGEVCRKKGKENVKDNLKLFWGEVGMRRKPFFLPLCSSTTRFPTLENRIQATTIVVFLCSLMAFFVFASLKSSYHNIVHIQ